MDELTRHTVNAAAIVTGYALTEDTADYPCIQVGGAVVFAYLHEDGGLRVALHFDEADPEVWPSLSNAEACVPVTVDAGGETPVWTADERGLETTSDTPRLERLLSRIDELNAQMAAAARALAAVLKPTGPAVAARPLRELIDLVQKQMTARAAGVDQGPAEQPAPVSGPDLWHVTDQQSDALAELVHVAAAAGAAAAINSDQHVEYLLTCGWTSDEISAALTAKRRA